MGEWFERSFGSDYMIVYKHRNWENAYREVRNMVGFLDMPQGAAVLDVGCGMGRHALALSGMGFRVSGVDLSEELLREAAIRDPERRVEWLRGDMRRLPFADGSFDATVNFFTSFGYFESEEENVSVLRELRRVLKPGGRFLIDFLNPSYVRGTLVPFSERTDDETGWIITESRRIENGAVVKDIRIRTQEGDERTYRERVRLYGPDWFEARLPETGLTLERLYGDYSGSAFAESESQRLIMTGVSPA
ncbi:SAM-dependent methyltransferase [Paenibacillus darwinianus]|uniref:SAM-dependent methyltransferase n=1 Tax=Paenibacillus darwinianus TaxID=1380763 RepID=A0A9W5S2B4_9BACL|nr:class I SAM-dependent methyltransferase [Paenibacillus darwinianus]EXX89402.1 SAM-dependent methyltransferase [Paenibacillus darwinianus]EXX90182.1 SAM-dependent methyltransferase [Paenibacillus darwinianus]EXX91540.1 SAM-dependent methyltransferase [Paenibacillus darwinianus]